MLGFTETVGDGYSNQADRYEARWGSYLERTVGSVLDATGPCCGRVLDLACGTGALAVEVARRWPDARIYGFDLSPSMLHIAARNRVGLLVRGDAQRLPFATLAFDCIVSTSALHEVPNWSEALREARWVLRGGGRLVVADWDAGHLPTRLRAWFLKRTDPHVCGVLTLEEAAKGVSAAGLRVERAWRFTLGWSWGFWGVSAVK